MQPMESYDFYLLNAFSLNMVETNVTIRVSELTLNDASTMLATLKCVKGALHQAVGHADTARVFAKTLGHEWITENRVSVKMKSGDTAIVGQYSGPRLPEGATTLPEGATIKWLMVSVS